MSEVPYTILEGEVWYDIEKDRILIKEGNFFGCGIFFQPENKEFYFRVNEVVWNSGKDCGRLIKLGDL